MGVNLLPQAEAKDFQHADNSLRNLVLLVVWIGALIVIFVILFFNQGLENSRLKDAQTNRSLLTDKINSLGQTQDDYYTLAYKTLVLSRVKTQQYIPSTIGNYVKSKVLNRKATVNQYFFDAAGDIRIQITADSYDTAVLIWHDLLKDKTIMTELDLNSFGQAKDGSVAFQLAGKLNLEALYQQNGITK